MLYYSNFIYLLICFFLEKASYSLGVEKKTIYFLLDAEPLTLMLLLIELEISLKIITKKSSNNAIFKKSK